MVPLSECNTPILIVSPDAASADFSCSDAESFEPEHEENKSPATSMSDSNLYKVFDLNGVFIRVVVRVSILVKLFDNYFDTIDEGTSCNET